MVSKASPMRLQSPLAPALLALAALGGLGTLPASRAAAADLDYGFGNAPPPVVALPESKVEFGSGWYIRGDIGATRLPVVTPVYYGTSTAPGIGLASGSKLGYTASLGGGYQFRRWFRSDLTADFNQGVTSSTTAGNIFCPTGIYYDAAGNRQEVNGGCIGTAAAHINSFDVLLNGYVDLGTWSIVTPYVGAGVGLAFGHYNTSTTFIQGANGQPYDVTFSDPMTGETFHNDYDRHSSGNYYNLAFALMAGVGIDIYPHTKLDINYRFLHIGNVLGTELYQHQARVGVRYMIDD